MHCENNGDTEKGIQRSQFELVSQQQGVCSSQSQEEETKMVVSLLGFRLGNKFLNITKYHRLYVVFSFAQRSPVEIP